jgi:methylated-DNA-[protein]-cysteine S-methyltransferase
MSRRELIEEVEERALREALGAGEGTADEAEVRRLAATLADRARDEGLLDLAYGWVETPVGRLLAAATERGLVKLSFPEPDPEPIIAGLAAVLGPRTLEQPARFDELARQLELYFEGRLRDFELPLDWSLSRGFVRRVLTETAAIPFGETRSYAEVAAAAGSPRAFRAAGSALGANPIPIVVPCHRVLRSGGALGGYGGGLAVKRRLLEIEGVLGP